MILKQVKDKWLNEFTNQLETGERKEINNTFNYYFSQYKKAIDLFLSQNQVNGFDSLFSLKDLNNIYLSTYVNIGMRFAEWYAKNHETLLIKVDTSIYRDNWERRFANTANQVAGERIVSVQGTARETLNKILKKYMADPEFMALNEREGQRILRSKFKQISKYQAQRIIRTEATNAANSGTLQSATDIFGKEQLQKKWISGIDERTRSAHAIANGQIVDFNKKFNVGGQMLNHAGDPAGSAANVVNCRCTVAPFPKPEAQAISEISNIGITPPFAPRIPIPRKPSRVPNPIRVATPVNVTPTKTGLQYQEAKTIDEAKELFKQKFAEKGVNITKIVKGNDLSLEDLNIRLEQFYNLMNKYSLDEIRKGSGPILKFTGSESAYGSIKLKYKTSATRGKLGIVDFGRTVKSRGMEVFAKNRTADPIGLKKLSNRGKSVVNPENFEIATLTHETAHMITTQYFTYSEKSRKFWSELRIIRKEYFDELRKHRLNHSPEKFNNIYLGNYASKNMDEFFAEAFTEYELSTNPSIYAKKVGELIKNYYGSN